MSWTANPLAGVKPARSGYQRLLASASFERGLCHLIGSSNGTAGRLSSLTVQIGLSAQQ